MTDKEQRYVLIAIPETDREETCPFYSVCDGVDDCGVLGLKYNTCKVCNAGMTRSEAIERMAKSLFKVDNVLALDIKWSQLKKSKQLVYKEFAEAALNALLEEHK